MGDFFAEFVNPRTSTLGLNDHLRLGLLPPIEGLYRRDLSAHDPDLFTRYRDHPQYRTLDGVHGVLASDAHLDHNGSLGIRTARH